MYVNIIEYISLCIVYQMYEGEWIRDFDQKAVNLTLRDGGKLKFTTKNWNNSKSINLLNVIKDGGIQWENEPRMKGTYNQGMITWENGQKWMRKGIY